MRINYGDGTYQDHADCLPSCPGSTPDPWTGHPGAKFPDCRTEALWSASLDWQPEQTGDVDGFGLWACIMSFPTGEYLSVDGLSDDRTMIAPGDHPLDIWIPSGAYVLCTNNQGFVWIESSPADGHGSAQARFKAIDDDYSAWLDQEDDYQTGETQ